MSVPRLQRRPGGRAPLAELLASSRFRLGPHTGRVAQNLALHGGVADDKAEAWIGADLPPLGAPSVSLGDARGTLGPHSFGFLDNQRGVAALAAPLPSRPRFGPVALLCPRRDALVDVGPLALARDLGVSWIISVGDGDPEEALAYLAADAATRAVLFAPGAGARPEVIRALGDKPAAVLGGDGLLRAAARRAGGMATEDLEAWLAFGALAEANVGDAKRPRALVAGGGAALIAQMARGAGLDLPVVTVDDDDPGEVERAVADAAGDADLLLLAGVPRPRVTPSGDQGHRAGAIAAMHQENAALQDASAALQDEYAALQREPAALQREPAALQLTPAALQLTPAASQQVPTLYLDPTAPERVRALLSALAARLLPPPAPIPRVRADRARAQKIVDDAGGLLGDHDTKRVLHAYGARVSRQAPANSPTAALRLVDQLGLPVDVVVPPEAQAGARAGKEGARDGEGEVRRAATSAELKRAAGVLLEKAGFVLIREAFEQTPRAQLTVRHEPGLGPVARIGAERALLPLDRSDAIHLCRAAAGGVDRPLVDLLARSTAAAVELELDLDLTLYVGDEPAVVAASARRRKTKS